MVKGDPTSEDSVGRALPTATPGFAGVFPEPPVRVASPRLATAHDAVQGMFEAREASLTLRELQLPGGEEVLFQRIFGQEWPGRSGT
jgi:hypothetical protein